MNEKEIKELKRVLSLILERYKLLVYTEDFGKEELGFDEVEFKVNNLLVLLEIVDEEKLVLLEKFGFDIKEAIGEPLNKMVATLISNITLIRKDETL